MAVPAFVVLLPWVEVDDGTALVAALPREGDVPAPVVVTDVTAPVSRSIVRVEAKFLGVAGPA
jgi:hypothetical protein